jgi:glycosyltransferase involved in cell wall biosynthesis
MHERTLGSMHLVAPRDSVLTVIFLQHMLRGGGAERVVRDLAANLDRKRYRPFVITLFEDTADPGYPADVPVMCVRRFLLDLIETPGAKPNGDPPVDGRLAEVTYHTCLARLGEGLREIIGHLGPNVAIVSVMEEATVAAWIALQGSPIPFIASLHTLESRYFPIMHPDPARYAVERGAFGSACREARQVVLPGRGCGLDLIKFVGLDERRVLTIANPVDCAKIRRLSSERTNHSVRQKGETLFVNVGRLDPVKGHRMLFQAFGRYRESNPTCRLICIGDGPYRATLTQIVAEMGLSQSVELFGYCDNPYPLLRQADALVLTSQFEAFGLVLVEAMICGVPVVSFDCPFGPSEVLDDGRYGILVPPDNTEALATAMQRVTQDMTLRSDLISAGYARALHYDVGRITRQWEELISATLVKPS